MRLFVILSSVGLSLLTSCATSTVRRPAGDGQAQFFTADLIEPTGKVIGSNSREIMVAMNENDVRNCAMSLFAAAAGMFKCVLQAEWGRADESAVLLSGNSYFHVYDSAAAGHTIDAAFFADRIEITVRAPSIEVASTVVAEKFNLSNVRMVRYAVRTP